MIENAKEEANATFLIASAGYLEKSLEKVDFIVTNFKFLLKNECKEWMGTHTHTSLVKQHFLVEIQRLLWWLCWLTPFLLKRNDNLKEVLRWV